jgi:hypothetical protein
MNGAGLAGPIPKDMVVSNVSGAVLRSTNTGVFIQDLAIPFSASTSLRFSDSTGTKFCNSFSGSSVVEIFLLLGAGQISGFKAITFVKKLLKVSNGLKFGNVGNLQQHYVLLME